MESLNICLKIERLRNLVKIWNLELKIFRKFELVEVQRKIEEFWNSKLR